MQLTSNQFYEYLLLVSKLLSDSEAHLIGITFTGKSEPPLGVTDLPVGQKLTMVQPSSSTWEAHVQCKHGKLYSTLFFERWKNKGFKIDLLGRNTLK